MSEVGNETCFNCNFNPPARTFPTEAPRFPEGRLLCQGNSGTTCQMVENDAIIFRDSADYLACEGIGTCRNAWNIENAGAACCIGANDPTEGQTCLSASIMLAPTGPCKNDMCCDGNQVCMQSTFSGLSSLSCRGYKSCSNVTVELERDLYCNVTSNVVEHQSQYANTCGGLCDVTTSFHFLKGPHVIDCLGNDACRWSTFVFEANSSISFECDSKAPGTPSFGANACRDLETEITLMLETA